MDPGATPHGNIAYAFAQALVSGKYGAAHAMLASALRDTLTVAELRDLFETMFDNVATPPPNVAVMTTLDQWPEKHDQDVGWAYVAIDDATTCEAVSVVVTHEQGQRLIREISWGRP